MFLKNQLNRLPLALDYTLMKQQTFTDTEIVEAFRAGGHIREKAWEFAYKDWRDRVVGTIVAKNGTREEAKEAMQEVVMAFERRVRQPDFELQHRLSTYFITCVYRQWLKGKMGQKMIQVELKDSHMDDFVESVEAEIAQSDLAKILDESLTRIGERCKSILRYFMNGFSMREIAEKMGFAGGEQVAKNEKGKCQERYESYLQEHPGILQRIQQQRNG